MSRLTSYIPPGGNSHRSTCPGGNTWKLVWVKYGRGWVWETVCLNLLFFKWGYVFWRIRNCVRLTRFLLKNTCKWLGWNWIRRSSTFNPLLGITCPTIACSRRIFRAQIYEWYLMHPKNRDQSVSEWSALSGPKTSNGIDWYDSVVVGIRSRFHGRYREDVSLHLYPSTGSHFSEVLLEIVSGRGDSYLYVEDHDLRLHIFILNGNTNPSLTCLGRGWQLPSRYWFLKGRDVRRKVLSDADLWEEARGKCRKVDLLLRAGGFTLAKWLSNRKDVFLLNQTQFQTASYSYKLWRCSFFGNSQIGSSLTWIKSKKFMILAQGSYGTQD